MAEDSAEFGLFATRRGKTDTSDLCILDNKVNTAVDANKNYWNSASPNFASVISGRNAITNNYYADSAKTNLVNN